MNGWIGFDLDGCLAFYDGWKGPAHIGEPVPRMADRVREFLRQGVEVRVVTARANPSGPEQDLGAFAAAFADWSTRHFGEVLPLTCSKDFAMVVLYDDRCRQVIPNTGIVVGEEDVDDGR